MLKWLLIGGGITGAGIAGFLGYRRWSASEQKRIDTLIAKVLQDQAGMDNKPEGWTPPEDFTDEDGCRCMPAEEDCLVCFPALPEKMEAPCVGMVEPDLRALAPIISIEVPQPRKRELGQVARYRKLSAVQAEVKAPGPVWIPEEVRESYERRFRRPLTEGETQDIRDQHDLRRAELVALRESIPEAMITRPGPVPEERIVEALRRKYPVQLCSCDTDICSHGQVKAARA